MSVNISDPNPNTIHLKVCGPLRQEEAQAGEAITPGHLVKLASTGKLLKHATSGGVAERAFAIENALYGKTIDDAYATNDIVFYRLMDRGDTVYALLADGENVAVGDQLSSNGDGTLQKLAGSETALAVALEAIDLSVSGNTTAGRIRARLL